MKLVTPEIIRAAEREGRVLSGSGQRLRRLADHLGLLARLGGPEAKPVELAIADLQCLLTDHLEPAIEGLDRLRKELERELRAGEPEGAS